METHHSIDGLRADLRQGGKHPVVLVPTMGALHAGHQQLIEHGRALAGSDGVLVVSIFVNPTQFGEGEDFEQYPRTLDADRKICAAAGADLIFAPPAGEMYHGEPSVEITESIVSEHLCGATRPGHFTGVCTVVAKLFNIAQPDVAVFGEKDAQQLAVIRRMVRDLNFPIEVVGVPTVREESGLAMSSRNSYLDAGTRDAAAVIRARLLEAAAQFEAGERESRKLIASIERGVSAAGADRIDYIEVVDDVNFQPVVKIDGNAVIAVAVVFGGTRLIDNIALQPDT